jgi:putative redox protein
LDAVVTWERNLKFTGMAESGHPVLMDSKGGPGGGPGPVELVMMALAGCTAMDVISILTKKKQQVTGFHVRAHAERAQDYPKVITRAELEYVVVGRGLNETALLRAIELSLTRYCAVHAMLAKSFPISVKYSILDGEDNLSGNLVKEGRYNHAAHKPRSKGVLGS